MDIRLPGLATSESRPLTGPTLDNLLNTEERIQADTAAALAIQATEIKLTDHPKSIQAGLNLLAVLKRLISENGSGVATVALMGAEHILKQLVSINRTADLNLNLGEEINLVLIAADSNQRVPANSPLSKNHSYWELSALRGDC